MLKDLKGEMDHHTLSSPSLSQFWCEIHRCFFCFLFLITKTKHFLADQHGKESFRNVSSPVFDRFRMSRLVGCPILSTTSVLSTLHQNDTQLHHIKLSFTTFFPVVQRWFSRFTDIARHCPASPGISRDEELPQEAGRGWHNGDRFMGWMQWLDAQFSAVEAIESYWISWSTEVNHGQQKMEAWIFVKIQWFSSTGATSFDQLYIFSESCMIIYIYIHVYTHFLW